VTAADNLDGVPALHVEGAALDLVELSVTGMLAQSGFASPLTALPSELPIALPVPAAEAAAVVAAGQVVLEDAEGVQVALVKVSETWPDPSLSDGALLAAGEISALKPLSHGIFRRLRLAPAQVEATLGAKPSRIVVTTSPLTQQACRRAAGHSEGGPVVVFALVGTGWHPYPDEAGLVQALRAGLPDLPAGSLVIPVPLPRLADESQNVLAASLLAGAYGASGAYGVWDASVAPADLDALLAAGDAFAPAVQAVLRAHRPPPSERGVALLFTGLSGSGKSTVAKGVADALLESTTRRVTFLDGDVVRRNLSKGLGFSRADRDANVRRIGFVAAEVARHGGTAICAPIAPYAQTRAAVRELVTDAGGVLVLVHVSTPIEVCEARDRKGLYALARAGKIAEFTGVSDPYEVPDDADLRLDTSVLTAQDAVDAVLELLRTTGLAPSAAAEREED
jgi:sulfate adenylyltransferase